MMRILYLMHLPWGWIKQRPHFLAEALGATCTVEVVYRFYRVPFEGRLVQNPPPPGVKLRPLVILPLNRFAPIAALNAMLLRAYLRRSLAQFEVIWFTHPELYEALGPLLPASATVVYDCMDNHCAFDLARHNPSLVRRLRRSEQALLERSDCIIASAQALRTMLVQQYGVTKPIHVVNNGIQRESAAPMQPLAPQIAQALAPGTFRLSYVGTIASWLDFDLLLAALERFPGVTILLFGPSEVTVPSHPRLLQLGPIPHGQVGEVMARSDALVMPFRLTELVLGVDPVKLYEYAASGRPALAIDYPEAQKFAAFVHLYKNQEEFLTLLGQLIAGAIGAKQGKAACEHFATANTWQARAGQIRHLLAKDGAHA